MGPRWKIRSGLRPPRLSQRIHRGSEIGCSELNLSTSPPMSGGYHPWSKFNEHRWSDLNARRHAGVFFICGTQGLVLFFLEEKSFNSMTLEVRLTAGFKTIGTSLLLLLKIPTFGRLTLLGLWRFTVSQPPSSSSAGGGASSDQSSSAVTDAVLCKMSACSVGTG